MTVQLVAPSGSNQLIGLSGTSYIADSNGLIQAVVGDVVDLLNGGCRYGISNARAQFAFISKIPGP